MKSKKKWLKKVAVTLLAVGFCICLSWTMFVNFISVPVLQTENEAIFYIIKVGTFSIFLSVLLCGCYFYIAFLERRVDELSEELQKQTPH